MPLRTAVGMLAAMLLAVPAVAAGELKLEFRGGYVTLVAQDIPARQILAEWARLGQTRIINGEKVTGAPLTLQFVHVPERLALDAVLRAASGYMAAERASASPGSSIYDRVVIMPTSVPVTASRTPLTQPTMMAPPPPVAPAFSEPEPEEREEEPTPVPGAVSPSSPGFVAPQVAPTQMVFPPRPQGANPAAIQNAVPQPPPGISPAPPNPWNITGVGAPGLVAPTPNQPNQPNQQPPRPPVIP